MTENTKIYLVRHAEALGNAEEFFQGNIDTMLTQKGQHQLEFLAERFRSIPLDAIYTSPFQRASLTAEAVNKYHGLGLIPEYELREINGGDWEGRRWSDLPEVFPNSYDNWKNHMEQFCAPNGDAMTDVYQRMRRIIRQIAVQNSGKSIAVVSHGCAIRNFLCDAEFGNIIRLPDVGWADNTAVSLVEYDESNGFTLIFKNNSDHLPPEYSSIRSAKWCQYETNPEQEEDETA
mgnify:CR=1 FL=1